MLFRSKDEVEDPGGDLRAVEGTRADVAITTDKPLASGILMMEDGSKLTLRNGRSGSCSSRASPPEHGGRSRPGGAER